VGGADQVVQFVVLLAGLVLSGARSILTALPIDGCGWGRIRCGQVFHDERGHVARAIAHGEHVRVRYRGKYPSFMVPSDIITGWISGR
jgi:hypothetical protein